MKSYLSIVLSAMLILASFSPPTSAQCTIPAQTAVVKTTNYTAVASDTGRLIVMNCSTTCTLTLPSTAQTPNWTIFVSSIGNTQAVVSPNGLTLNGSTSSITVPPGIGEGFAITTDSTNYFTTAFSQSFYAAGGGTANAQTALATNLLAGYPDGLFVCWKPAAANTTTNPTLNVSGLAPTTITKFGGQALAAGDVSTTAISCAIYNSTGPRWDLVNPQATSGGTVGARRVCDIAVGDTSGSVITNAQLGPQKRVCYVPAAAVIQEVDVAADAGTPNVIVGVNHAGSTTNLLSSALATAASGGIACAKTSAVTCIDGVTTASAVLQNNTAVAGDYLELVSGTAGGTAKFMTIHIVYTVN